MSVASEPESSTVPGTVFTPRQVRMLKIAVIVMGVLLVGGFAFVLAAMIGELLRQRAMGLVGLGDDEEAARVLVEAMHDAGARHAADA